MRFLRLLKKELAGKMQYFAVLVVLSALSAALILAILNFSIVSSGGSQYILAGAFVILLLCFVFVQYKLLKKGWEAAEKISDDFRKRLSSKILNSDLSALEKIDDGEICERLTQETSNISHSAGFLIPSIQTVILLLFVLIYLGVIFPVGMGVFTTLILIGFYLYRTSSRGIILLLKRSTKSETKFYGLINDILKGIKEIKFFSARKSELMSDVKSTSSFLRKIKQKSYSEYSDLSIYSQAFFFLVIGVVVFVLPRFETSDIQTVIKLITTAFFIMGPALGILFMLPMFEKIDLSLEFLENLEEKLDSISEKIIETGVPSALSSFEQIEVKGLQFDYNEPSNGEFKIGPVDLDIKKGEIIFFTGGNGSGKTTLLKAISSVYRKSGGDISVNGNKINDYNLEEYRNHFSAIFSDFHLFAKLYGFENPDKQKIYELLSVMKIENKTAFDKDGFTNLNLSTGQKKRLALIVSLLEDKPVMIFDEWAAEQDQYFREYFYNNILPELKRKEKTVLVVSHDERYFSAADKIIKMDFGKIAEVTIN